MSKDKDTAKIRRELMNIFDEISFSNFCFDYFWDVYNCFSQGMRKDQKVTLLLEHCYRQSNGFETLLNAVYKECKADNYPRKGFDSLINALKAYLNSPSQAKSSDNTNHGKNRIFLPRIKRNFNDFEKELFCEESFKVIKQYFQTALLELKKQSPEVESRFMELTPLKFVCKIYLAGQLKKECKIWGGSGYSLGDILYREGIVNYTNDNSYNEYLNVVDDGVEMFWQASNLSLLFQNELKGNLNQEGAAEYLWRRFTYSLNT